MEPQACPRSRTTKASCQRCLEVCPTGALHLDPEPRIVAALCTGCGGCAAVCPTGAVTAPLPPVVLNNGTWRLACYQVEKSSPWPCLLGLHWQTVALALEQGLEKLELVVGPCGECVNGKNRDPREQLLPLVRQVAQGLGLPEPEVVVEERPVPLGTPQAGVSRRALLAFLQGKSQEAPRPSFSWREEVVLPQVAVGEVVRVGPCFLCPACVHACTGKALRIDDSKLVFDGSRCNGCRACADACGFAALEVLPKVVQGGKVLTLAREGVCSQCGEGFLGEAQRCPRCSFLRRP